MNGNPPSRYSQCGRILKVLQRGGWVSTHDLIYVHRIPGIIHSRISELRRDYGFEIEHRKEGNNGARSHQYRLTLRETPALPPTPGSVSLGALAPQGPAPSPGQPASPDSAPPPQSGAESLTLFGDEKTHYSRDAA